jgi:hypothetical protein
MTDANSAIVELRDKIAVEIANACLSGAFMKELTHALSRT